MVYTFFSFFSSAERGFSGFLKLQEGVRLLPLEKRDAGLSITASLIFVRCIAGKLQVRREKGLDVSLHVFNPD